PQNDVTLKMPAFEWVHVQLHQQKGMISLSPPTICNSAIQTNVCGCVSEKAPNSVTAVELAAAALDVNARATIVNQVVSKTVNACVAEALQK
ncbi:hypothetical protein Q4281_18880, partial [Acinetobacter baumannii]